MRGWKSARAPLIGLVGVLTIRFATSWLAGWMARPEFAPIVSAIERVSTLIAIGLVILVVVSVVPFRQPSQKKS